MNEMELIAKQALQLAELGEKLKEMRDDMAEIHMILCGIGGPLNDNVLGYSADQRKPLHRIESMAASWLHEEE